MSGAMRKIGEYLGLLEDTGRYEDELDEDLTSQAAVGQSAPRACATAARPRCPTWPSVAGRRRSPAGQHGRRAVADHHPAPAHLQRGAHGGGELPRGHAR